MVFIIYKNCPNGYFFIITLCLKHYHTAEHYDNTKTTPVPSGGCCSVSKSNKKSSYCIPSGVAVEAPDKVPTSPSRVKLIVYVELLAAV